MVLPFLLGAAALAAGAVGIRSGVDAAFDDAEANEVQKKAQKRHKSAKQRLEKARNRTIATLEDLGKLKLEVWSQQLGRFVELFSQLKNVELTGQAMVDELKMAHLTKDELAQMKDLSAKASEVLIGGTSALGGGALAGIASYGGATMFASASTGTAISSLAGAAATNATLAWFGGGSLAAGGLGMAGGMAVLGGIVAGPVLAVGGLVMSAKARKFEAEVKKEIGQMESAISILDAIEKVAKQFDAVIRRLAELFTPLLHGLESAIATTGNNYADYSPSQKRFVHLTVQFAQVLKLVLETPLLTKEGAINESCYKALEAGQEVTGQSNPN